MIYLKFSTASSFYFINANSVYIFLINFFIPFIILLIAFFIFSLLYTRYIFEKNEAYFNSIENEINIFLTELIFSNYSALQIKNRIKSFRAKHRLNENSKKYILNKIIHIKENLNDSNELTILLIYKYFEFDKISKKLIENRKWSSKSEAIQHYQNVGYKIKTGHLKRFLNSKNKTLRSNAIVALISLSDKKFEVLENYKHNISKSDEVKILDIIYQKKAKIPKNLHNWLNNDNDSIVIIAIKLLVRFRCKKNISLEQISKLLKSENQLIRKEIIIAIQELLIIEANKILINHYKKETNLSNKILIIKTFNSIGNSETLKFATSLLLNNKNTELSLKLEIVNYINKSNRSFFKNFKYRNSENNFELQKMIAHSNCPYLN